MDQPTKPCAVCGQVFAKKSTTSRTTWSKQATCSWPCRAKAVGLSKIGRRDSDETRAKKSRHMQGKRNHRYDTQQSDELIAKRMTAAKGKTANERHWNWKGNDAGYLALHGWLNRHYPRKGICERCGQGPGTQYANIKGHIYTRNREDYEELCRACHNKEDGRPRDASSGRFI